MKNTKNIIILIISFALVLGIIFGAIALTKNVIGLFDDVKESETEIKAPDSESKETDTSMPSESESTTVTEPKDEEDPDFYLNSLTNTGYSVVDNKTYFFIRVARIDSTPYFMAETENWIKSFDNYTVNVNYSFDAKNWTGMYNNGSVDWFYISKDPGYIYVSYTVISNCVNPSYVLEDLNQNVFFNTSYFKYQLRDNPG